VNYNVNKRINSHIKQIKEIIHPKMKTVYAILTFLFPIKRDMRTKNKLGRIKLIQFAAVDPTRLKI
jgi:hypothetical protein